MVVAVAVVLLWRWRRDNLRTTKVQLLITPSPYILWHTRSPYILRTHALLTSFSLLPLSTSFAYTLSIPPLTFDLLSHLTDLIYTISRDRHKYALWHTLSHVGGGSTRQVQFALPEPSSQRQVQFALPEPSSSSSSSSMQVNHSLISSWSSTHYFNHQHTLSIINIIIIIIIIDADNALLITCNHCWL